MRADEPLEKFICPLDVTQEIEYDVFMLPEREYLTLDLIPSSSATRVIRQHGLISPANYDLESRSKTAEKRQIGEQ